MYYIVAFTGDPAKEKCFYILLHLYRDTHGREMVVNHLSRWQIEENKLSTSGGVVLIDESKDGKRKLTVVAISRGIGSSG
ncbi:hypothetical protein NQ318_000802 [Aromia moschata]|uniref:Uncharacterized protein n=1 Tax=Aromia moschata TaxID=1265417 RepID=A0AAV8X877_9CUCU|nr:hypothetical protein NQ318_000802 [Aromia moschata]